MLRTRRLDVGRGQWQMPRFLITVVGGVVLGCHSATEPSGPQFLWKAPGKGWGLKPSYDSTTVYFGGFNHDVVAVDKRTGSIRWRGTTGASGDFTDGMGTAISGNTVALTDVHVYVFDRRSGQMKYVQIPDIDDNTGRTTIAADDSTIYTPSFRGKVFAFRSENGSDRWVATVGDATTGTAHPLLDDGVLFVPMKSNYDPAMGAVVALDARTGSGLWRTPLPPEFPGQWGGAGVQVSLTADRVFVGAYDGRVYGLDRATGAVLWIAPRVHTLPPSGGYNDIRPTATNGDVVIVGSTKGIIVGLDVRTGAERWRNVTGRGSASEPIATNGRLAFVPFGSNLVVFEMTTGRIVWESGGTNRGLALWASPTLDGDRLYVAGTDGFYAFRFP